MAMAATISDMAGSDDLILRRTMWRQSDRGVKIFVTVPRTQHRKVGKGAPSRRAHHFTSMVGTPSDAHSRDPLALPTLLFSLSSPRARAWLAVADQAVEVHADVGGFG